MAANQTTESARERILAELRAVLSEMFEIDPARIHPEADLKNDLGLDSIDAIDMAARLQSITGKKLELGTLKSIRKVADVVNVVEAQLEERA